MEWRDGHASTWKHAIRQTTADYDSEILAWEMALRFAENQAQLAAERIELLKRDRARRLLTVVDVAVVPAIN